MRVCRTDAIGQKGTANPVCVPYKGPYDYSPMMPDPVESVRIQKYLAERGVCSRREAEKLITEGGIMVNGKEATIGQKIVPGKDRVVVQGRGVAAQRSRAVTLAMNKPTGVVCTNFDPHNARTVFDYVPSPFNKERLFCAGRLDKDSEGLLIITSDGALSQKLTHPSYRVVKRYQVTLTRPFDATHIPVLLRGFEDEGEFLKAEKVFRMQGVADADRRVEVHMEHGKKREVRRLFERMGYFVERLVRTQIGGLTLRGIGAGRVKVLSTKEISLLFRS